MGVIWYKVWYDLWNNKLRTLLVVTSIAVGVFAVGTTFGMVGLLLPTMDASHQLTVPSHVTIYLAAPVDRDVLLALKKVPGVENIEPINAIEVRYKIHPQDKWHKGNILMRDDYDRQVYDIVQLKAGVWPQGKGMGIERMHSPFYGIDIGDKVIFKVGDQERTFFITGKIRHPFVPPPSMYDMAWFFSGAEVMEQFGIPLGTFNQFKIRVSPYTPDHAREVATAVKDRLAMQGIQVAAAMYQKPDKHWGRDFVDGAAMVTQVLAVISLLLSVILVLNTLTAVITQQTNQIGILKAIGGSSYSVAKVYLVGVFIYGLLALCISLPLGTLTAYKITSSFLSLYNIEFNTFSFSTRAIIYQVAAALVVPLLAGLIPIFNGAAVTVRQAISTYGLGTDFSSTWLDRAVERIGQRFLVSYYAMALVNTFRRKGRLLLTQLVLVIAGVMFLMVMSLSSSIKATTDAEFARRDHDLIISFNQLQRIDRIVTLVRSVEGVEKAGMWLIAPATIISQGQRMKDAGLGSQLQGVPVEDPMYIPMIVEGRWLQPGDDRVIVMNKQTADDEHIRVSDTITLDLGDYGKSEWQVIGLYKIFLMFGGGYSIDALYAPRQAVFEVTKKTGKAGTLLVRTTDHSAEQVTMVASRLEDLFQQNNIEINQTETIPTTRKTADSSFSMVVGMLMVLAVIVALVGAIGLMGSLSISVIERTKEIGVMRAIGGRSNTILSMFIMEGVVQGFMSWVIAVPLSFIIAPLLSNALGIAMFKSSLDYQYNYTAALTWLLVVLVISVFSSVIPARNATLVNVRQSLTYE